MRSLRDDIFTLAACSQPMTLTMPLASNMTCVPPALHAEIEPPALLCREGNDRWQPLPAWAGFLLRLGYRWRESAGTRRRVAVVSMPCESAAASLVALGAMRRRLEEPGADDIALHFKRMKDLATSRQDHAGLFDLRLRGRNRGPYFVERLDESGLVWVRSSASPVTKVSISPFTAVHWKFEEEPPLQVVSGGRIASDSGYASLLADACPICPDNLARSDSLICLATRAAGESATRSATAEICLGGDGWEAGLDELLTIRQWSSNTVSRVALFNTRTGQLDRQRCSPGIVVADGDMAFLKVLDNAAFNDADVIGIVPRTLERDRLEEVGRRLAHLEQWYGPDIATASIMPSLPRGIAMTALARGLA